VPSAFWLGLASSASSSFGASSWTAKATQSCHPSNHFWQPHFWQFAAVK